MIASIIIYLLFGIIFYSYGLYTLKKYKQEAKTVEHKFRNYILMAFLWPLFVFKAINILAKTGAYK